MTRPLSIPARTTLALSAYALAATACLPGDLVPDAGDVESLDVGELDAPGMMLPDSPITDFVPDAFVAHDADVDGSTGDVGFDCGSCASAGPCEALVCESSCDYESVADGTFCMEDDVCVDGACVERVCGNGWRDPGEGCDDGNLVEGDGCDAMCAPEVMTLDEGMVGMQAVVGAAAAGMDDAGNLLVAWVREVDPGTELELVAQRFDRRLRAVDEVPVRLDLGPSTNPPLAAVVPLSRGWALAWPSTSVDELGIAYLVAPPTGAYTSASCAHEPTTHPEVEPTLARTDEGFVVAWQSRFGFQLHVRARRFDGAGAPLADEFPVTAPDATPESLPVIFGRHSYGDASGTDQSWSVAYVGGAASDQVLFADYEGGLALGAATQRVFHIPSDLIAVRDADGVLVGTQSSAARGTINVRWLEDATTYTDDAGLTTLGGRAIDEDLAVAAVPTLEGPMAGGGGEWLALWRSSNTETRPMGIVTSPGIEVPPALFRLQDDLVGVWEVEDISVGRAGPELSDGWIVTYIAITDTTHRLNVFHLTF